MELVVICLFILLVASWLHHWYLHDQAERREKQLHEALLGLYSGVFHLLTHLAQPEPEVNLHVHEEEVPEPDEDDDRDGADEV